MSDVPYIKEVRDDLRRQIEDTKLEIITQVTATFDAVQHANGVRFEALEKLVEDLEQRFGMLFMGYSEMAVMVQVILERISSGDPEDVQAFAEELRKGRAAMLDLIRSAASGNSTEGFTPYGTPGTDSQDPSEPG